MPVIIAPEDRERWLKGPNPGELLRPYAAERMTMWPVSPQLNNVKNDRPDLLDPIEEPDAPADGEIVSANEGEPEREPTNSE
jgi:putative SOS response-associated peptidase YedK